MVWRLDLRNHLWNEAIGHGEFGMFGDLPTEFEILRRVGLAVVPLEPGAKLVDCDHGLFLHVDFPGALFHRWQFFSENGHAFQSHRILKNQSCISHAYMLGVAAVVVAETRDRSLS